MTWQEVQFDKGYIFSVKYLFSSFFKGNLSLRQQRKTLSSPIQEAALFSESWNNIITKYGMQAILNQF